MPSQPPPHFFGWILPVHMVCMVALYKSQVPAHAHDAAGQEIDEKVEDSREINL